ncbi:MAG: cation transporter [Elusimicrobiota bacterium]
MNKMWIGLLTLGLAVAPVAAKTQTAAEEKSGPAALTEGRYQAGIKAIVCAGCGKYIQNALKETKGIKAVSVDQENARVLFTVKKGAVVKTADVQKNLTKWADKMGMGADFTLTGLAPAGKAPGAKSAGHTCCPKGS